MGLFGNLFTKICVFIALLINSLLGGLNMPQCSMGERLDMSKFDPTPTFAEEFNGDSLDTSTWGVHYGNGKVRRGGYWDMDMAQVYGGNLHIKTKYYPEGLNGDPAGWYSAGIDTSLSFSQTYGYAECRCILPEGSGHWSAFWLFSPHVGDVTGNGYNGAEIDVMESAFWHDEKLRNTTAHAIHFDGYGEHHQSAGSGNKYILGADPYKSFHTYGVEWNENEYRFYIDGMLTDVTDFGGVSKVPEYLILSVEVGGQNGITAPDWAGVPIEENKGGLDFTSDFIVDYVRVYRYKK